eukprot:CAMPEP_0185176580 /NCGR_PEP_ID=MMETSP1139-20130426/28525_1 /TAXON_ID=298111 /ORGANISM="Pavlova sp., Strain CCMP459" /LENGTH=73 /DNA_ID=CAMNT_0027742345 /DNA_START=40 /DNA_END=261 /DNA_ORIENTATION=+
MQVAVVLPRRWASAVGHHRRPGRGDDGISTTHLVGDSTRCFGTGRGAELHNQRVRREGVAEGHASTVHTEEGG